MCCSERYPLAPFLPHNARIPISGSYPLPFIQKTEFYRKIAEI